MDTPREIHVGQAAIRLQLGEDAQVGGIEAKVLQIFLFAG